MSVTIRGVLPVLTACLVSALTVCGCASRQTFVEPQVLSAERSGAGKTHGILSAAQMDERAEMVRRNPEAYLRLVTQKCRRLEQYTLTFTRHERRGLFQQLYGPERIACWFRRQPFSVRMKWLDEDIKYGESVYVEGQADNKVRFVTRWWSPPLLPPPAVNRVDLETPVAFGESKRPMTDFGLERLMERTLTSYEQAGQEVVITYGGLVDLPDGRTVHHIHLEYPPLRYRVPIQELYIDVASDLPAGTVLKLADGRVDAAYFYADINTDVTLTDDDFRLAGESQGPAAGPPAP